MARGRPWRSSRDHCWPFIVGPGEHPDRHEVGVFGAAQWLYRAVRVKVVAAQFP
jgi:hypothetical protein